MLPRIDVRNFVRSENDIMKKIDQLWLKISLSTIYNHYATIYYLFIFPFSFL